MFSELIEPSYHFPARLNRKEKSKPNKGSNIIKREKRNTTDEEMHKLRVKTGYKPKGVA